MKFILVVAFACTLHVATAVHGYSSKISPTDNMLIQMRQKWKSASQLGSRGHPHHYVQEAYINMAVMCSSQARQLGAKDLSTLDLTDRFYRDSLSDYGNCLFEMADFLQEHPDVGANTPELKFQSSGLQKSVILERYSKDSIFMLLQRAAELGQPEAQHRLATAYSTGILHGGPGGIVPMDAGKGLFLEYMSALSGSPEANMGMGYRYANGIGVPESCEKAQMHYEIAANHAVNDINRKGYVEPMERVYLSDLEKATTQRKASELDLEVINYYMQLSDEGDSHASMTLGKMFSGGNRAVDVDFEQAAKYYKVAGVGGNLAALGSLSYLLAQGLGGKIGEEYSDKEILEMSRRSAARGETTGIMGLGYCYLMGIGMQMNHTKAFETFEKIQGKHGDAAYYMGEMLVARGSSEKEKSGNEGRQPVGHTITFGKDGKVLSGSIEELTRGSESSPAPSAVRAAKQLADLLNGLTPEEQRVVSSVNLMEPNAFEKKNLSPALRAKLNKFQKAAASKVRVLNEHNQVSERAEKRKGSITDTRKSKQDQYAAAAQSYAAASQRGHTVAIHRLAHMSKGGIGVVKSCHSAMHGFKSVAERGYWVQDLNRAHRSYDAGDYETALRLFARLAAIGYETAQFNAAHLLASNTGTSSAAAHLRRMFHGLKKGGGSTCPTWALPGDKVAAAYATSESMNKRDMESSKNERSATENSDSHFEYAAHFHPSLSLLGLNISQWNMGDIDTLKGAPIGDGFQHDNDFSFQGDASANAFYSSKEVHLDCEDRALALYGLSASQGNAEAYLRIGDFYYYGMGHLVKDNREAVSLYQSAADLHHTHALFNLGLMHELGDGVTRDFHLAKRFYDQAAEYNPEALLPRNVAIGMLSLHKWLHTSELGESVLDIFYKFMVGSPKAGMGDEALDSDKFLETGETVVTILSVAYECVYAALKYIVRNEYTMMFLLPFRIMARYTFLLSLTIVECFIDSKTKDSYRLLFMSETPILEGVPQWKRVLQFVNHLPLGEDLFRVDNATAELALFLSLISTYFILFNVRRQYRRRSARRD